MSSTAATSSVNPNTKSSSKPSSMSRKPMTVRSTRTPIRMPTDDSKLITATKEPSGGDKLVKRAHAAPTEHASSAPRSSSTANYPLSITPSHSSDNQGVGLTLNPRESIASSFQTEPSSYYSADDSIATSAIGEEDIPPLPDPHPLSRPTISSAEPPATASSSQTVIPTQSSGLAYRTSARTTASTSTRFTGRSGSTSVSVIEPSRQSTSDSEAYPRGNGHGHPLGSKIPEAESGAEEELENLIAGLEGLVEEPEFEEVEQVSPNKGKMRMPGPQSFGGPLPTTHEEDEDEEGGHAMRMPEPHTHSRNRSSSSQKFYQQSSPGFPVLYGTTVRKASPLVIPPTPKSPPPVPSPTGDMQRNQSPSTEGRSSHSHEQERSHAVSRSSGAAAPSLGEGENESGTAPFKVQRHARRPSTGGVGQSTPSPTSAEKDKAAPKTYGTATITSTTSSRIERPGSGYGGQPRISMTTASTNVVASGRPKTDSISSAKGRPFGRTTSSAGASGAASRPGEMRMSISTNTSLPPLPKQNHEKPSTTGAVNTSPESRSRLPHGETSQMDTQYVNMLLALDDIPKTHNIAIAFFNWIYLAGFVLLPGTFTSLQNLGVANGDGNALATMVIQSVTQLPLFIIAWVCVGIGGSGMLWLCWRWRKNYIWALNKIWTPGFLNSLAGLLSTIASIYGAQHGQFSTTSRTTLILTGVSTCLFGFLTAFYLLWLVRRVKNRHDKEVGIQRAGRYGEGIVDFSTRRI